MPITTPDPSTPAPTAPAPPAPARPDGFGEFGEFGGFGEPQVTAFTGRADGAEVSVGVQPGGQAGRPVVLLRVSSPWLGTLAGAYLGPDEADRVAAALSAAARAAAGASSGVCPFPAGATEIAHSGPAGGECAVHTEVTAVEGTTAADLSAALALLPPNMVLTDFSSDVDVCLIFKFPAVAGAPAPRGLLGGLPAGERLGPTAVAA